MPGRHKALLIGNSTFPADAHNLQTLEGPVNDISRLREALTHPQTGIFERENVRLLPEREFGDVLREMDRFFADAQRDDCLLVYYSGHGRLNELGQLFLCVRDTRTDYLRSTAVSNLQMNQMIDSSAARTTVIVLDCCYSGAFKGGEVGAALGGTGRYVLASSRGSELANDTDRLNGTSAFTRHLVDALEGAAPDDDGDGYVELSSVYDYVHDRLTTEHRQIPQRIFSGGGDVTIARRPALAEVAATPVATSAPASEPPLLALSETLIEISDVEPGERLASERVFVLNRGGGELDWTAESDSSWMAIVRGGDYIDIHLHPNIGTNRGKVTVRDRVSRSVATLRVVVRVRDPAIAAVPREDPTPARPLAPPSLAPAASKAAESPPVSPIPSPLANWARANWWLPGTLIGALLVLIGSGNSWYYYEWGSHQSGAWSGGGQWTAALGVLAIALAASVAAGWWTSFGRIMTFVAGILALVIAGVVAVDVSTKGDEGEYGIQSGLWVALAGAAVIAASATEPATRALKRLIENRTGRAS